MRALTEHSERVAQHVPRGLRRLWGKIGDHQLFNLAGGLAFFGLISFGPAVALALGLVRFFTSPETVTAMVEATKDTFPDTLQLPHLLEQMEGQSLRYAGFSLLVLLWPATTLAGGWQRALDAVNEIDGPTGLRTIRGRGKGLLLGLFVLFGVVVLVVATTVIASFSAERVLEALLVGLGVLALQHVATTLLYAWFPSRRRPLRAVWLGAIVGTVGVGLATAGFGMLLTAAGSLAQRYPPSLSTAVVLGLWLYATNLVLLLGDEVNVLRGDGAGPR